MFRVVQGKIEHVKLERLSNSVIMDKRKLFDLFTKILDRGKKDRDEELIRYVEEATDLWTQMMQEEYDHDQKCLENVVSLQHNCAIWLKELQALLDPDGNHSYSAESIKICKQDLPEIQRSPDELPSDKLVANNIEVVESDDQGLMPVTEFSCRRRQTPVTEFSSRHEKPESPIVNIEAVQDLSPSRNIPRPLPCAPPSPPPRRNRACCNDSLADRSEDQRDDAVLTPLHAAREAIDTGSLPDVSNIDWKSYSHKVLEFDRTSHLGLTSSIDAGLYRHDSICMMLPDETCESKTECSDPKYCRFLHMNSYTWQLEVQVLKLQEDVAVLESVLGDISLERVEPNRKTYNF